MSRKWRDDDECEELTADSYQGTGHQNIGKQQVNLIPLTHLAHQRINKQSVSLYLLQWWSKAISTIWQGILEAFKVKAEMLMVDSMHD